MTNGAATPSADSFGWRASRLSASVRLDWTAKASGNSSRPVIERS
jgi:hypothetical protein